MRSKEQGSSQSTTNSRLKHVGNMLFAATMLLNSDAKAQNPVVEQMNLTNYSLPGVPVNDRRLELSDPNKAFALSVEIVNQEKEELISKLERHTEIPSLFDRGFERRPQMLSEDLRIYYETYKTVAAVYGLSWVDLWVIHEEESMASRHKLSDNPDHLTGMQIDKRYFNEATIREDMKANGIDFVNQNPDFRYPNDAVGIYKGAQMLKDFQKMRGSLRSAFGAYVHDSSIGNFRYDLSQRLQKTLIP